MAGVTDFDAGGYRYVDGPFQYSLGVAAKPGFAIERARLRRPLPLHDGFAAVETFLKSRSRSTTALCAIELRSPAPFTEQGFVEFNREYVKTLERWALYRDGRNPVARTNVCPLLDPPAVPSLHAFSYTAPSNAGSGTFVVAGAGETREGATNPREAIVRRGETSTDALRDKIRCVMAAMERRLAALGFGWADVADTQAYTVLDIGSLVQQEILAHGAARDALVWHFSRPPVVDLEFEMDVRTCAAEVLVQGPLAR